jgi:hypothetical protein
MSAAGKILRVDDSHPRSWFVCLCEQRFPTLEAHEKHKVTAVMTADSVEVAIKADYAHALWKIVT